MPHPGRNNIYDATIKRMVNEALEAQELEFAKNRGGATNSCWLICSFAPSFWGILRGHERLWVAA